MITTTLITTSFSSHPDVRIRLVEGGRVFYEAHADVQSDGGHTKQWVEVGRDVYLAILATRRVELADHLARELACGLAESFADALIERLDALATALRGGQ